MTGPAHPKVSDAHSLQLDNPDYLKNAWKGSFHLRRWFDRQRHLQDRWQGDT
jgi:hypothetical protein